jgi:hypothetical protein
MVHANLSAKLGGKDREILALVVGSFGLGDVATIEPDKMLHLDSLFDDFLGMLFEGSRRLARAR